MVYFSGLFFSHAKIYVLSILYCHPRQWDCRRRQIVTLDSEIVTVDNKIVTVDNKLVTVDNKIVNVDNKLVTVDSVHICMYTSKSTLLEALLRVGIERKHPYRR